MSPPAVPAHVPAVLAVAVVAISAAAVLVGALEGTHPLALALWRTAIVGLLLSPWIRWPSGGDLFRIGLAGLCLAGHFVAWFTSLQTTTILRSTVLVCLAPVWTGLAEWALEGRRPPARWWLGLALALPGAALLSADPAPGGSLWGDGLAVLGGLLGAAYFLLGRRVRAAVGIGTYGSLVCVAAAVVLAPAALAVGVDLWGFTLPTWAGIAALALGPQLLGHNGFNYALRFLPASVVSAATLLEPVGAALLAWAFLGQAITAVGAAAGLACVVGVGLSTWTPRRRDLTRRPGPGGAGGDGGPLDPGPGRTGPDPARPGPPADPGDGRSPR